MADYTGGVLVDPADVVLIGTGHAIAGYLLAKLVATANDQDYVNPAPPPKTTGQLWPRGDW